ncbi:PLP-dependent aminotransferase family protein [Streptantibioticus rubrisoli]|uniref:MocR-like pyridoxine biosynthesis transcription factor PdxR n=1 Tax=Streptantibioticus rubrisoli TaxID=1387313 RepID=UPI00361F8DCB
MHLELSSGAGLRSGLETALRDAVRDGRLAPGTRLPSSRALARDLGLARNTVAEAYGQLVAEGWLTARQGSGTRVAPGARPQQPVSTSVALAFPDQAAGTHLPYDLRPGKPDLSSFPRTAWVAATRQAMAKAPHDAFGYTDPRGRVELREALAEYLSRVRGVRANPDLILVCTGYVQAIGLLGRVLAERGGQRIAVEALGFSDTRTVLRESGLATTDLPVDEYGADIGSLADVGADAVLLTPAHQFPSGVALSPERRTAAVEWAHATGGVVIEDDYDGEFRYDRQPVGALQGLDPANVVYAGTASKSLAPGIRLAWLVLPERLMEPLVRQKRFADRQSPVVDQLALAELIVGGAYDRHVRRMRSRYRLRRDRLVSALATRAPGVRVSGIAAGMHVVVELPDGYPSEGELIERAARLGLAVTGMHMYGGTGERGALVVGYGTPPDHAFSAALEALCAALAP